MSNVVPTTIEERLIKWLNAIAYDNGLPSVMLDYASDEESISFQTVGVPQTKKEYINGSRLRHVSFRLARVFRGADTSSVPSIDAINGLVVFSSEIQRKKGGRIDGSTTLVDVEASTPSLLWRSEEGTSAYGITINIDYKED